MNKTCQKCGASLQENDFLCPNCGAIYGQPVYEAPKQEEQPAPAPEKQHKLPLAVVSVMGLLVVIVCVLLWNPFQPAQTPTTAPAATSGVFPTISAVPMPPPTTEPATVPTTVPPTTLPFHMKRLDWTLNAKVVDPTGRLISNGTVKISGLITKNADAADTIVLTIVFPSTCSYLFGNDKEYFDRGGGLLGPIMFAQPAWSIPMMVHRILSDLLSIQKGSAPFLFFLRTMRNIWSVPPPPMWMCRKL